MRYEDLVHYPVAEVRRLYAFLDLPYTALVDAIVSKHTQGVYSADHEMHPFSIAKTSKKVVFAWRRSLPFSEVDRIQQECGDVLRAYGYRHFSLHQYEQEETSPLLSLPQSWGSGWRNLGSVGG